MQELIEIFKNYKYVKNLNTIQDMVIELELKYSIEIVFHKLRARKRNNTI